MEGRCVIDELEVEVEISQAESCGAGEIKHVPSSTST